MKRPGGSWWGVLGLLATGTALGQVPGGAPPTGTLPPVASGTAPPPPPAASAPPPAAVPSVPPVAPPPTAAPPYGAYPPPGPGGQPYSYPYPYGYELPPYQPQPLPAAPRRPQYPEDAAAANAPYVDVTAALHHWEDRFSEPFALGLQVGHYFGGGLRLELRGAFLSNSEADIAETQAPSGSYFGAEPVNIDWVAGVGVGVVGVATSSFVMAPGVGLSTTGADLGYAVTLDIPLVWVAPGGMRVGFDVGMGRVIGGTATFRCGGFSGAVCGQGSTAKVDLRSGTAFHLGAIVGFGFNPPRAQPKPPPEPEPEPPASVGPAPGPVEPYPVPAGPYPAGPPAPYPAPPPPGAAPPP